MKYRHELKHEINAMDLPSLRMRLSAVMKNDSHAEKGSYFVRSLYFDTAGDKALREKIDGVNTREKFRIRYYNGDTSYIMLEKKRKINGLCTKESCRIACDEAQKLLDGDLEWMRREGRPLCLELYTKMAIQGLRPKTIVDYEREPFVYEPGNVRVTIDYNIRTGDFRTDFLSSELLTLPAGEAGIILEIKWDEFLPDIIRQITAVQGCRTGTFSKYAQCRIYG